MKKEHLVSTNLKTGWSINTPIHRTCSATSVCKAICYARKGRLSFKKSLERQERVYRIFKEADPNHIAREIGEGYRRKNLSFLRWCGSGDLFTEATKVINITADNYPESIHWVVTRKPEMVKKLAENDNLFIMFSLDGCKSSIKRKLIVDRINHPRVYYSYLRQEQNEDTLGASIIFNAQQKKKQLKFDDAKRCCPVDAGIIPVENACIKCRKCFSPNVLKRK